MKNDETIINGKYATKMYLEDVSQMLLKLDPIVTIRDSGVANADEFGQLRHCCILMPNYEEAVALYTQLFDMQNKYQAMIDTDKQKAKFPQTINLIQAQNGSLVKLTQHPAITKKKVEFDDIMNLVRDEKIEINQKSFESNQNMSKEEYLHSILDDSKQLYIVKNTGYDNRLNYVNTDGYKQQQSLGYVTIITGSNIQFQVGSEARKTRSDVLPIKEVCCIFYMSEVIDNHINGMLRIHQ